MKQIKYNFLKFLTVVCICMSSNLVSSQWNLADTTIQSARDVDFPHPNAAYLTTDMGILFKSTDGGVTWSNQYDFGVFSSLRTPRFINKDTGFVSANYGIMRTFDGGQSWTNILVGNYYEPSSFSVNNQAIVISGYDFNNNLIYVKKSIDYGNIFITIMERNSPIISPHYNSFLVSFIDSTIGYVINPNELEEVYKTINGGISFDTIQITNGQINLEEKFQFKDAQNGYLYGDWGSESNPSRTWNTGTFYFPIDLDGFGVLPVLDLEFIGNKLFASTLYGKIFYSLNNGQSWIEQTTPVNNEVTSVSFFDEMNGIAVSREQIIYTKNGGVLGLNSTPTDLNIVVFPNPTRNWLYIDSANKNIQSLTIYDLKGQFLKEFSGNKNEINIENLEAGTYLLKIEIDSKHILKKIIIE